MISPQTIPFSGYILIFPFTAFVGLYTIDQVLSLSSTRNCPVVVRDNGTGLCRCTELLEIHCADLDFIPDFMPDDLTVYSTILMARQSVKELPRGSFENFKVRRIVLAQNPIGSRVNPGGLAGLEDVLEELDLGGCGIGFLPAGMLRGMKALRRLFLWNNRLRKIPSGLFVDASNLTDLLLWGNNIEWLSDDSLEGLGRLRRLDLDRNRISLLSRKSLHGLSALETLSLSGNELIAIPGEAFTDLEQLRVLNLDENAIGYISGRPFDGLSRLISLSLSNNRISILPDYVFAALGELRVLRLDGNHLEHVWGRTFSGLRSLVSLNLSRNRLSSLPNGVFSQSRWLSRLSLDGNRLSVIGRCVLSDSATLRSLSLTDNPLVCECRLGWIGERERRTAEVEWGQAVWGTCRTSKADWNWSITHFRYSRQPDCVGVAYDCHGDTGNVM